jgi:hypothetical protein
MTTMSTPQKPQNYRDMIDQLVRMCQDGQGQIGARKVHEGVWNRNAGQGSLPEQHRINLLLQQLSPSDRETIADLLRQEVVTGVFETLKVLEEFQIEPFTEGYEGSPYHDFVGRLSDWSWPED